MCAAAVAAEGIFKMLGNHRVYVCTATAIGAAFRGYNIVAHFSGICREEESACYNGGVAASGRFPQ